MKKYRFQSLLLILLTMPLLTASAGADCRLDYDEAVKVLDEALDVPESGQSMDANTFEGRFSVIIDRMVTEQCEKELIQLFEFAENEKLKRVPETESLPPAET